MSPDELDNRIRAALGGEPSAGQIARVERFWTTRSHAERRRRTTRRAAAIAATVAVVATAAWRVGRDDAQRDAPLPAVVVESPRAVKDRAPAPTAGREPTAYERLVFTLRTRKAPSPEQALATRLAQAADDDQRRQMIRELGERGAPASLPALLEAAAQPAVRDDALAAVERIVGVDRLAEAVRQARDAGVRTALVERLLADASPATLDGFLSLAADPATGAEALEAALRTERLPVAALVAALDGGEKQTRVAAALVLGRVNGPVVSEALIARVSQGDRAPVEAWVALLACRGETVDRFLAVASRQPRFLGQVNSARVFWARMTP